MPVSHGYHDQGIPVVAHSGSKKAFLLVMSSRIRLLMVLMSELMNLIGEIKDNFLRGENAMTEFKKVLDTTKTHTTSAIGTRLRLLVALVAAMVFLLSFTTVRAQQSAQSSAQPHSVAGARAAEDTAIRPFHVNVPQAALDDLRRRLAATKWPEQETVTDPSQGVQLATMKALVHYWQTDYDWRKVEARLNALPQFITNIDGLDIHFIHVKSRHPNALPLIITHGWPGSIIEQLKIIGPLTDPTAFGGRADDAFDVVIPSLPGYGFSGKPTAPGWTPIRIASAWTTLMKRLGYTKFVAQGGDWGNAVSEIMALQAPP